MDHNKYMHGLQQAKLQVQCQQALLYASLLLTAEAAARLLRAASCLTTPEASTPSWPDVTPALVSLAAVDDSRLKAIFATVNR